MNFNRKQKKYLKKNLRLKTLAEIASDLKIPQKEIENYLRQQWGEKKFQKFIKNKKKSFSPSFVEKVSQFNFREFFKKNWQVFWLLALITFIAYFNSLGNEFVSDDIEGILNNKNLDSFSYLFSLPDRLIRFFQPALYILLNKIFGKTPTVFRLVNILFHLGTAFLVYILLFLLSNRTIALFTALILAVHPIATESVTWISGGGHVMYSFFLILSLIFYILIVKNQQYLYLSLISFFLALTISEKAFSFPLTVIFLAVTYKITPRNLKKIIPLLIPFLILALFFLRKIPERISWLQTTFYQENKFINPLIQMPISITSYLELIFWPKNLTLYHSEMNFTQFQYLLRLAVFFLLLVVIFYFFKKNRPVSFWLAFFIISLLPTLIPFGISWIVAERYVYLGAIGIFVVVALGLQKIGEKLNNLKISYAILIPILLLLTLRTTTRNTDWKNQDTLWLATAKTSPSSPQNHNNLGDLYARRGDLRKAAEEFKKAIELKPNYADAYHNLANTYQKMGKTKQAIENYQKALSFNPNLWQSHQNLAALYFDQRKYALALQELKKAIQISPQNPNLYLNLGIVYLKLNDNQKAQEAVKKAIQLDPENQKAKQLLLKISS